MRHAAKAARAAARIVAKAPAAQRTRALRDIASAIDADRSAILAANAKDVAAATAMIAEPVRRSAAAPDRGTGAAGAASEDRRDR